MILMTDTMKIIEDESVRTVHSLLFFLSISIPIELNYNSASLILCAMPHAHKRNEESAYIYS